MQQRQWAKSRLAVFLVLSACLVVCGNSPTALAQATPQAPAAAPATVAYVWANGSPNYDGGPTPTILEFSIDSSNHSPIGTLTLPDSCGPGPLATDSVGNLYVGCDLIPGPAEVLVYAPNSTGPAAPLRVITLTKDSYEIMALTVDANDVLYVGAYELVTNEISFAVIAYPNNAWGSARPLHTIRLPYNDGLVDIAVASGEIYVVGYPIYVGTNGPSGFVNVYSPSGSLLRRLDVPYFIDGVAVDQNGALFLTAQIGPNYTSIIALQQFSQEAFGSFRLINSTNLTRALAPGSFPGGGTVRLDAVGNIFTPLISGQDGSDQYVLYGFGQNPENNSATPIAQVSQSGYDFSFAVH